MRRLDSYYFTFKPTGHPAIDDILAAVARAGSAYHHTEGWTDDSPSQVDLIQEAANKAANEMRALSVSGKHPE